MKKVLRLLPFLVLSLVDIPAMAQTMQNVQAIKLVVPYKTTCARVSISNSTPTEVTGNTNNPQTSYAAFQLKVVNLDTSADLYCSNLSNVTASGSTIGDVVAHGAAAPWNWLSWTVATSQPWYCLSTGGGPTFALVCLSK